MNGKKIVKRAVSILPAAVMMLFMGLIPMAVITVYADQEVQYVERRWNGMEVEGKTLSANCTEINGSTEGISGWYVVEGNIESSKRLVVTGTANIILKSGSRLYLKDGINVPAGTTLNIYSEDGEGGELYCDADTNDNAAIGANDENGDCGTVNIHGGKITADTKTKGTDGAGIGGGDEGNGGTITIYGGKVNATGGDYAAGIGAGDADGDGRDGGTVRIYGGEVTAQGGCDAAGIGGGEGASGADVEIWGGTVKATGGSSDSDGGAGIGSGDKDGRTVNGGSVKIYGGDVTAQGGPDGAGVGGGNGVSGGTVVIEGGTVNATGGVWGAGIGGGEDASSGDITIRGGEVTATGGDEAAGIGGGNEGDEDNAGTISISGGTVIATGGEDYGAGIGGGDQQRGGTINITGGDITATGGNKAAGIGGGDEASGGTISISGGTVIATGGGDTESGAGIGSGRSPKGGRTDPMSITLSGDCDVKATGGSNGAGIGGGHFCWFGEVTIEGGTVVAQGGEGGPGIGNGYGYNSTFRRGDKGISVTITGGNVKATGGSNGAGIGGGHGSISGVIQIDGGTVEATGGDEGAAGIGTGSRCCDILDGGAASPVCVASVDITINGGSVIAKAGALNTKANVNYPGVAIGTSGSQQIAAVYRHTYFNGKIALNGGTITAYAAPVGGDNPGYPNHGMVIGTSNARNFENSAVGNVEFNGATVHMYPASGSDGVKSQTVLASSVSVNGQRVIYNGITATKDNRVSTLTSTGKNYVLVEPCTHAEATLVDNGDTHTGTCSHCGFSGEESHRYSAPTEWNWNNDNTAAMATFQCACGHEVSVKAEVTLKEGDDTKYVATATLDGKTYTAEADRLIYDINVEDNEYGSIEVNSTARVGSEVGLDVVPDEHYHLKSVAGDGVTLNHVEGNHYTFTMPKGNVTLRAEFDPDTYEVIWKDYDGTALRTDTVTYGESYTLPGADTFTKPEGKCVFKSLELKVGSADAVAKEPREAVEVESDMTITAVWKDHDWSEISYEWAADDSKVTATRTCQNDSKHVETETAEATSEVTRQASCTEKGETTYTSEAFENTAFIVQTKKEDIQPLNHDWNEPTYTWNEDNTKVTATHICKRDAEHVETETVSATSEVTKQPTCEEKGETTYTSAAFTKEGFKAQTKTEENIDALGHSWGEATYTWAEDNSRVTATHRCTACKVRESEKVYTTSEVTKDPTCSEEGEMSYTSAAFDTPEFEVQTKTGVIIPIDPNKHDWGEWKVTKEPTTTEEGKETRTCSACNKTETRTIDKLDPDPTPDPEPTPAKAVSGTLMAKAVAKGSKSLNISWTKVQNADGYDIYFARCNANGRKYALKKVKTVKGNKTFKWTKGKLAKRTAYKAVVKAYTIKNGKKTYVRTSPTVHAFTSGYRGKYTNPKNVTVTRKAVNLKKGKTYKIKAKVSKLRSGKRLPSGHAANLRYLSSNKKVATVSKSGKVTAKGTGSCTVYVYAANGIWKTVRVTVK